MQRLKKQTRERGEGETGGSEEDRRADPDCEIWNSDVTSEDQFEAEKFLAEIEK